MLFFLWMSLSLAQIEGRWVTEDQAGIIEVYKSGDTFEGKIVGGEKQGDGLDGKNPDPKLRSREVLGLVILTGLKKSEDGYIDGRIYDPNSGNTYRAKASLLADGRLKLRGYIGISLFGRNETWTREKP